MKFGTEVPSDKDSSGVCETVVNKINFSMQMIKLFPSYGKEGYPEDYHGNIQDPEP